MEDVQYGGMVWCYVHTTGYQQKLLLPVSKSVSSSVF